MLCAFLETPSRAMETHVAERASIWTPMSPMIHQRKALFSVSSHVDLAPHPTGGQLMSSL